MNYTIKDINNKLYRGYRIISGKEGRGINDLLVEAIEFYIQGKTDEKLKYQIPDDELKRELIIKNISDELYQKLENKSEEEKKDIDNIIIDALYAYVFDQEVEYRKELLNIEEDEFH